MLIEELDKLIKTVCPIDGLDSVGNIWWTSEATEEQKKAAIELYNLHKDSLVSTPPEVIVATDPIERVKAFLAANPDIAELIKLGN